MGARVFLLRVLLLVAGLAAWEVFARVANPLLYVPPSAVLPALGRLLWLESYPDLLASLLLTLREILVAYALAVGAGLAGGFALGIHRVIGRAYGPILAALYAVPAVVWYPSLMLFFGLGEASKIAFGFLLGFFPITLAVWLLRPERVSMMLFTLVGGLRTGLALTVIGVIVGEILGSRSGMGALINHAYGLFRTSDYVALVLVTLVLIVGSDALAGLVERRAQQWTE